MQEIINHTVSSVNIIPTILLMFCIGYWLVVVLGFLSMDSLDVDVDFEIDVDVDVDIDVDVDADVSGSDGTQPSISWLNQILLFFNLAHIPLMVFLSFLALPMWFASMVTNYFLDNDNFFVGLVILIPVFFISLFIAKFLTTPLVKVFKHLSKGDISTKSYLGKICQVILVAKENVKGQAELNIDGGSYLITTTTQPGVEIKKGENALIIDFDEDTKSYLIEPYYE